MLTYTFVCRFTSNERCYITTQHKWTIAHLFKLKTKKMFLSLEFHFGNNCNAKDSKWLYLHRYDVEQTRYLNPVDSRNQYDIWFMYVCLKSKSKQFFNCILYWNTWLSTLTIGTYYSLEIFSFKHWKKGKKLNKKKRKS